MPTPPTDSALQRLRALPRAEVRAANGATAQHWGRRLWCVLLCAAVALPWLNPFASGPKPSAVQFFLCGFCAVVLLQGYGVLGRHLPLRSSQDALCGAWLLAALMSSAMSLLQYLGLAAEWGPWINYASAGEAFANLRQRNQFASLTSIGLVCVLYLGKRADTRVQTPAGQLLLWGCIALLALGNAASASRTGALQWLMVAGLGVVWAAADDRRTRFWALGALAAYALAVLALPVWLRAETGMDHTGLIGRLDESMGCSSRLVLWANVAELIAQHPWLGWGWGELKFAHFSHAYAGERFCEIVDNAHNLPLHLAVELGLPITLGLCAGLGWLVWRGKPWRETDVARQMAWGVLAIIGLHSLVEYPLWYGPFQMAAALCIWLLWSSRRGARRHDPSLGQTTTASLLGLATLGLLVYAAWDYNRISQLYLLPAQRLPAYRVDTLEKARPSWLFAREVQFADITITPLNAGNAAAQHALALQLLHFSPEPRVLQTLLESADLLGLGDAPDTRHYRTQFQRAYPDDYARWAGTLEPALSPISEQATP